jgi:hypothetical protein
MLSLVFAVAVATTPLAAPAHPCSLPVTAPTGNHAPQAVQKLGDLPDANMVLAVVRRVDGCDYQQIVGVHVSGRDGLQKPCAMPGAITVKGLDGVLAPIGGGVEPVHPTTDPR